MRAVSIVWTKHHECRPPEAIQGILSHFFLSGSTISQCKHDFITLTLMETLLFTHAYHRSAIGTIRAAAKRHLIHNSRTIHQPAYSAYVGPGEGRIVEY